MLASASTAAGTVITLEGSHNVTRGRTAHHPLRETCEYINCCMSHTEPWRSRSIANHYIILISQASKGGFTPAGRRTDAAAVWAAAGSAGATWLGRWSGCRAATMGRLATEAARRSAAEHAETCFLGIMQTKTMSDGMHAVYALLPEGRLHTEDSLAVSDRIALVMPGIRNEQWGAVRSWAATSSAATCCGDTGDAGFGCCPGCCSCRGPPAGCCACGGGCPGGRYRTT